MKNFYIRDKFKRQLFFKNEISLLIVKFLIKSDLKYSLKCIIFNYKNNTFSFKSLVRIKNRCYYTTRSKSIFKFFKISRIMLKELGSFGYISGLRKSSW